MSTEESLPPCDCRDGSDPCPECGRSVFHIDCNVWHAMREVATAARCYYTCTGISCTPDDLAMCRDNLNRALLALRELEPA